MIDSILKNLEETWGFTQEELADIRMQMLNYAFSAVRSPKVQDEIADLLDIDIYQ